MFIYSFVFACAAKAAEAHGQLKTVKATLDATRQEMMEYKEKATRILQVRRVENNTIEFLISICVCKKKKTTEVVKFMVNLFKCSLTHQTAFCYLNSTLFIGKKCNGI